MKDWTITDRLLVLVIVWLLLGGKLPGLPSIGGGKPTAAVYVYEKDDGSVPPAVLAGLDKLNRQGIVATTFEDDTLDGSGQVPDQYKVPLAAAKESGLPSLVVSAGDKVLRTVKAPTTEAQVIEAAK